ncbi:hypothetical protein PUN28_004895 [Cardiocondyla obscurior]|uniref:Uncharacterized protein n=1 Tax=Cardiocondyla obscurior TaxID=286306 RepID=A0AAW2GEV8_9HYME
MLQSPAELYNSVEAHADCVLARRRLRLGLELRPVLITIFILLCNSGSNSENGWWTGRSHDTRLGRADFTITRLISF